MTDDRVPFPTTGALLPDYAANEPRVTACGAFWLDLYVPNPKQEDLIAKVETLRRSCLGRRGQPLPGRRLLQESQAGKTSVVRELRRRLADGDIRAGREPNPYRALHVELKLRITVKMLYQRILHELGDPEAHGRYNLETLVQRCQQFLALRGTELLLIDEVQYLSGAGRDARLVADELKGFLDQGWVPVIFIGDLTAKELFDGNQRLTGRLGTQLELPPINRKAARERRTYSQFVKHLDQAMVGTDLCGPSDLGKAAVLTRLHRASGGHLGRTCRIVEAAMEHACARGAEHVETFDLFFAVEHLAIPAEWTKANPFSRLKAT